MASPDVPAGAWQTAADIQAGRVTSVEVVTRSLARIHELQPVLNAFTVVLDESALASARDADEAVRRGGPLPALHGVPVSVKDHIWMADAPATNGSLILRDFVPPADAVPVSRLRAAGAVIVGKTNNPEFCYRGFTDNLIYGLTRNPWDLKRTPGGSSGGAGSSVAAGMTAIALGTDGGGSIRRRSQTDLRSGAQRARIQGLENPLCRRAVSSISVRRGPDARRDSRPGRCRRHDLPGSSTGNLPGCHPATA